MAKLFPTTRKELTHSAMQCFNDCRMKYHWRYERGLVPTEKIQALEFGSAFHKGLEFWFKYGIQDAAIGAALDDAEERGLSVEDQIKLECMLAQYMETYDHENFTVVEVEKPFRVELRNPKSGRRSQLFDHSGKIDGLVQDTNCTYLILEHKTTSDINDAYRKRILIDAQICEYAIAIERMMGITIAGAIYDVAEKPRIKMKLGETDEEFEARKAELLAKSKTGKTTAKKQEPETGEEFKARVMAALKPESFQRFTVLFGIEQKKEIMTEMWSISQDMKTPKIYKNTGMCSKTGMECPYLDLCSAKGDLSMCEGKYESRKVNEELEV